MDAGVLRHPSIDRFRFPASVWVAPVVVALAYYASAHAAFFIGTLSDRIFAPFWPPNVVLFCALVVVPARRWWAIIAAVLPAHILAELHVGMSALPMTLAFVTNCAVAAANAVVLRWLSGPPWFGSIRKAAIYIAATAGVNPAITSLAGAFVPIFGGASLADYPYYWATWYVGNALASLTIGPILLTWMDGAERLSWTPFRRLIEPLLFVVALTTACILSLEFSGRFIESAFRPAMLYLPLPAILWGAVRFGEKGASTAILILTVVSIWMTLNGHSPFLADTAEKSVVALQLFLFGIAIPAILFSAAVDELRTSEQTTRKLVDSVLKAQDDERRRIARELHDTTAQHLVGASLLTMRLERSVPSEALNVVHEIEAVLRQSIQELRLLSYMLHPPQLENRGLAQAIAEYAEGFSERSGVRVDLELSRELGQLPREIQLVVYRVIQEALTNVHRHSGSETASIRLARRRTKGADLVTLAVEDAGRGIPEIDTVQANARNPSRGLGLISMRERVQEIGGRLRIVSAPGRTVVSATIPIAF
jgi:signal transduction histidine kinase